MGEKDRVLPLLIDFCKRQQRWQLLRSQPKWARQVIARSETNSNATQKPTDSPCRVSPQKTQATALCSSQALPLTSARTHAAEGGPT